MDGTTASYGINFFTRKSTKDWRKVLQFGNSLNLIDKRTLLWVWPSEREIELLGDTLAFFKITKILSIGCGNGLLEWILKESLDISVFGLEIDREWWQSKYAVQNFIELNYIDDSTDLDFSTKANFLQKCCHVDNWNFCLMFCYFNNREAFLNYLHLFKGEWLIIIGPRTEVGICTDPLPLDPHLPDEMQWNLQKVVFIGTNDVVAFYKKTEPKS